MVEGQGPSSPSQVVWYKVKRDPRIVKSARIVQSAGTSSIKRSQLCRICSSKVLALVRLQKGFKRSADCY
jgi:hypothetical protein